MASSSSSSSNTRWNFDVFLSFRGADTRNTFTGHLYQALYIQGINVFIDDELERGKVITSELLRVIGDSRISIVVLSERYASSSFCLDELVKILECGVSKGQTVIPVFYHVDPTDVEEQTGTFGQEFAELEAEFDKPNIDEDFNLSKSIAAKAGSSFRLVEGNNEGGTTDMERVQNWRLALTKVATLAGFHLKEGNHEANVIKDIVNMVLKPLDRTVLLEVPKHPVGVASIVEYILKELSLESDDVRMLGLYGMGGIGKSAIARALYNRCVSQFKFDGMSFLSDVRECSKMKGLAPLQECLLSEILGDQKSFNGNFEKGSELIKRRLCGKKVFIVIDDVDDIKQLRKLAGELEWFGAGSRIIITTRNQRLLEQHDVAMIYKVERLEDYLAIELFSWHAFKEPQPREAYLELTHRAIRYAQGLPLALEVLGSSLYKESIRCWEETLKKLEQCRDDEINENIFNVLKVSYDSLDREGKIIFLDIAFFLKGKNKETIIKFLDGCGFSGFLGVKRLIEKSLLYDDSGGVVGMHDLLEEMGNRIAFENSSRLCIRKGEDISGVFLGDKSPHGVEGILLDFRGDEEVTLDLSKFTKLRILVIRSGRLTKVPNLPNNIRWLEWHACSFRSIPLGFLPAELVVLEMPCSSIVHLQRSIFDKWRKGKKFLNLTRMDFIGCELLRETVDFSAIPNLEVMDLNRCKNLKKIDVSIGNLKKLQTLDLNECCSLTSLPNLVENQSLKSIDLADCSGLKNLPNLPTTLIHLSMRSSGIKEIPLSIGNLINLEHILASNCKNLVCVSNSIYKLPNIETFELRDCPNLSQLPEAESSIVSSTLTSTNVDWLDLSGNKFVSLPKNTFKFIHIKLLSLCNCELLVEIPELAHTLEGLDATNCKSLVRFSQFQFDEFEGRFSNCHKITENEMQSWREMVENVSLTIEEEDYPTREYSIILPGNQIPEWFRYAFECEGDEPSFTLPPLVPNNNLIAIAWCAVFDQFLESDRDSFGIQFSVGNSFKINYYSQETPIESEHMWLGFCTSFRLPKLLEAEEISCKFCDYEPLVLKRVDCKNKAVVLKRVGVHFIYK